MLCLSSFVKLVSVPPCVNKHDKLAIPLDSSKENISFTTITEISAVDNLSVRKVSLITFLGYHPKGSNKEVDLRSFIAIFK